MPVPGGEAEAASLRKVQRQEMEVESGEEGYVFVLLLQPHHKPPPTLYPACDHCIGDFIT